MLLQVTGGASGLGEGTTREIVARGGKVAVFDLNEERGEAICKELGAACAFFKCNVMDEDSIDAAVCGEFCIPNAGGHIAL